MRVRPLAMSVLALALATGCAAGDADSPEPARPVPLTGPNSARVSWTANREAAVNGPGGGYRVYYSSTPNFDIGSAEFTDVPYDPGLGAAPTAVIVDDLPSGTIYFKVVAYSALNRPGASGGSASEPSQQAQVMLP
ncbi:MAG TPA: fibronectin type III domain-containing protein [Thermodesulfobacteriota bacterium]